MIRNFTIHHGHVLDVLRGMESESVHCVVTSPPYWNLRDYGTAEWIGGDANCDHETYRSRGDDFGEWKQGTSKGSRPNLQKNCFCGAARVDLQVGLEPSPEAYVSTIVDIFRELRRVLRKDGTCWLNIGPTYAGSGCGWGGGSLSENSNHHSKVHGNSDAKKSKDQTPPEGFKAKDIIGIPWLVAFALQRDGWYLRSEIIWAKPAPMPESVTDRPTRSHEQIFLLTKSERYFYDQSAVRQKSSGLNGGGFSRSYAEAQINHGAMALDRPADNGTANLRDVWTINTEGFRDAHFAVFPTEIPRRCILAGTSEKGVCAQCGAPWTRVVEVEKPALRKVNGKGPHSEHGLLGGARFDDPIKTKTTGWQPSCKHEGHPIPATVLDPFCGSGTTGLVALRYGRRFIGIELNESYVAMAQNRIRNDAPLLNFATT